MFCDSRRAVNFSLGFEGIMVKPYYFGYVGLEKPPYGMLGSYCKHFPFIIRALLLFKSFCRAVGL
jgi:hypothetical protein